MATAIIDGVVVTGTVMEISQLIKIHTSKVISHTHTTLTNHPPKKAKP